MKKSLLSTIFLGSCAVVSAQDLKLNELDYFERQGVNVLVFSNSFNGGFNDEKNSGIEIIHHGVRTIQGGAVRKIPYILYQEWAVKQTNKADKGKVLYGNRVSE